ncbi:unnamed protein product [Fraxinus pennsylvanica]|uniref:Uncharacterized protein n=1 Tax=Fraxinus pennsylvanica TaxID=56036 RepID=A0AAD1ZH19_9LAMI|nr:unnamed protein product [Fraxinus pennsylvanica]
MTEVVSIAIALPVSQESHACKLLVVDPAIKVEDKMRNHLIAKPLQKDSYFRKQENELSMPREIKNAPVPLLCKHINHLLQAARWVIGRCKREIKYNGGEYVYRSSGGRPRREFHRTWSKCVLVHITICSLKNCIVVDAKRSLAYARDSGPAAKYPKISGNNNTNILFEVPIISGNACTLLGGSETHQENNTSSQNFNKDGPQEEGCSGYGKRVHKKSRKMSEMKVTSLYQLDLNAQEYSVEESSSGRIGSKKIKARPLHLARKHKNN